MLYSQYKPALSLDQMNRIAALLPKVDDLLQTQKVLAEALRDLRRAAGNGDLERAQLPAALVAEYVEILQNEYASCEAGVLALIDQ